MSTSALSDTILLPEDLNVLQDFLEAWCAENSVTIDDTAAQQVAVGLIDWYRHSEPHKIRSFTGSGETLELPPSLQSLLEKL